NTEMYSNLLEEITEIEVIENLKSLADNKATGPSKISNEMLKHLNNEMLGAIRELMNDCLSSGKIPAFWKMANIYPISKPKEWNHDLNNTRPITLLDTIRKVYVKILNNRLAKIFVENSILKGNQFAGLPNQSTIEPIRILNEIIEDAKEKNRKIYI